MHNINWASGRYVIPVPHLLQGQPLFGPGFLTIPQPQVVWIAQVETRPSLAMRRCFSYIWLMDPACISSLLLLLLLTIPSRLAKRSGCFASPYPRTAASRIAVGTSRTARLVVQRMSSFETRRLVKYGSSPQHVGKVRRQQRPDQKIGRRGPDKIRGGALVARTRGSYRGSA
jgi:hypothetical protein